MMEEHEEYEDEKIDPEKLAEDEHIMKFHFLALFLERAIHLFPNSVELRIHNSYMQS
jgi:PAS domain S-box-containing protein